MAFVAPRTDYQTGKDEGYKSGYDACYAQGEESGRVEFFEGQYDHLIEGWITDGQFDHLVTDRAEDLGYAEDKFDPVRDFGFGVLQNIHSVMHTGGPYGWEFCGRQPCANGR